MSHGADVVKSIVDSLRKELTEVSLVQKDVLNLDDRMNAAQFAFAETAGAVSARPPPRGTGRRLWRMGGRRVREANPDL
jgi:hypothetical protein